MNSDSVNPRVILVTSQVTYVPDNYGKLFQSFFAEASGVVAGVVFLKNLDTSLLKSILGLRYLGAKQTQKTVIKNVMTLRKDPRKDLCDALNIPHLTVKSMNSPQALDWCRQLSPHIIINARTRCIYKSEILSLPHWGCVNIHHGILPKYRGTMCDLYALSEGRPAGFSIHRMNSRIDDGPIFMTQTVREKGPANYMDYLSNGSLIEGRALADFIRNCQQEGQLPEGLVNSDPKPLYSKNPTRPKVSRLKQKGMVL